MNAQAEQEAKEEAEALAYFEKQNRICPVDDLRLLPTLDSAESGLSELTDEQKEWIERHRDEDTPSTLHEDSTTKRLFLLHELAAASETEG